MNGGACGWGYTVIAHAGQVESEHAERDDQGYLAQVYPPDAPPVVLINVEHAGDYLRPLARQADQAIGADYRARARLGWLLLQIRLSLDNNQYGAVLRACGVHPKFAQRSVRIAKTVCDGRGRVRDEIVGRLARGYHPNAESPATIVATSDACSVSVGSDPRVRTPVESRTESIYTRPISLRQVEIAAGARSPDRRSRPGPDPDREPALGDEPSDDSAWQAGEQMSLDQLYHDATHGLARTLERACDVGDDLDEDLRRRVALVCDRARSEIDRLIHRDEPG